MGSEGGTHTSQAPWRARPPGSGRRGAGRHAIGFLCGFPPSYSAGARRALRRRALRTRAAARQPPRAPPQFSPRMAKGDGPVHGGRRKQRDASRNGRHGAHATWPFPGRREPRDARTAAGGAPMVRRPKSEGSHARDAFPHETVMPHAGGGVRVEGVQHNPVGTESLARQHTASPLYCAGRRQRGVRKRDEASSGCERERSGLVEGKGGGCDLARVCWPRASPPAPEAARRTGGTSPRARRSGGWARTAAAATRGLRRRAAGAWRRPWPRGGP